MLLKRTTATETLVARGEVTYSLGVQFPIIPIPYTATVAGLSILSQ